MSEELLWFGSFFNETNKVQHSSYIYFRYYLYFKINVNTAPIPKWVAYNMK